jgi:hypothetical protein
MQTCVVRLKSNPWLVMGRPRGRCMSKLFVGTKQINFIIGRLQSKVCVRKSLLDLRTLTLF